MNTQTQVLRLVGADVLTDGGLTRGALTIEGSRISDRAAPEVSLRGYVILPGIVDLHGDAFERHIAPRPTAPFPARLGLISTDRDAAAHGVTTAYLAQSWSWEGGKRGPDYAESLLAAHRDYAAEALTDLRIQIRCETHMTGTADRLIAAVRDYGVDYVVFNNHIDEAVAKLRREPARLHQWAADNDMSPDGFIALVQETLSRQPAVPRFLNTLASAFEEMGVRYGSHDDPDGDTREYYSMMGARICEFPTGFGAASLAHSKGEPILAGAPNVVRGGSQAGNLAVAELIRRGQCDALVSDYHYPALAAAAFRLVDDGLMELPQAWAMISSRPARVLGMTDRGEITEGKRADLVILNAATRVIEGTLCAGRWSHMSGALAMLMSGRAHRPSAMAAE